MQSAITRVPIASVNDQEKTCNIIIEPHTHMPFCDMCNSFDCMHVKYAMTIEKVRIQYLASLKRICAKCGNYTPKDAKHCDKCDSKVRVVQ
jgi:ribosomal protein L40E